MAYSAIDGDISDFIDSQIELRSAFRTDELRDYLLNAGHPLEAVLAAIVSWQREKFWRLDPAWEMFSLSAAGTKAVDELRPNVATKPVLPRS